jgi:virulence factor Mce-like protein
MQKQAPSIPRLAAMVLFGLSCFGLLIFLWISFGGAIPLEPNQYQLKVNFPEATTLAEQADVRVSGVTVGKVRSKSLDKGANRTHVVLLIDRKYAPLPKDTHAILRQKTLLGETYVELTPGDPSRGRLKDGDTLPNGQVEPTVALDQILTVFDPKTKQAFRDWVAESARQISGTAPQDLNDALGNLAAFATDGSTLLQILDQQSTAVHDLVRNTGQVFQALNQRQGALHDLVLNSHATFSATAQEQAALAQTFQIFPTFLDQSRLAVNRLQRFATNTHPLVNALKPAATDLAPTIRNLGNLAPDLQSFFTHLKPVIKAAPTDLPQGARFLRAAAPVLDSLHPFLTELNPFLSYLNYTQQIVAHFLTNLGAATSRTRIGGAVDTHLLNQIGIINGRSLNTQQQRPIWDRGNTYIGPTTYDRATLLKIGAESLSCPAGTQRNPIDSSAPGNTNGELQPCFPAGPSLYSGTDYPQLLPGKVLLTRPPSGLAGPYPADPEKHP